MKLFGRRQEAATAELEQHEDRADRFRPASCAGCARVRAPYVYMSNGKDYCIPCVREMLSVMRMAPAGKRESDLRDLGAIDAFERGERRLPPGS